MNADDKHRRTLATAPKPKRNFRRGYQLARTEQRHRQIVADGAMLRFITQMAVLFPYKGVRR